MLTVSLHGIRIVKAYGLYKEEHILNNEFEVDVDVFLPVDKNEQWPFADYTLINQIVLGAFKEPGELLETLLQNIHSNLTAEIKNAQKIRVVIRKMHPPMPGDVRYAQVSYEA